jgi:hypothetical protein
MINPGSFLDKYLPRFITEEVALQETHDGFIPMCAMQDIKQGEFVAAKCIFKSFNLFGLAICPRMIEGSFIKLHELSKDGE